MCFVWISEKTAIISLYSINWLGFITETECVYCAVRTGSLNVIHVYFTLGLSKQLSLAYTRVQKRKHGLTVRMAVNTDATTTYSSTVILLRKHTEQLHRM
jgi:hypothetical protein